MKEITKLIENIDLTAEAPIAEPERQYYYIKKDLRTLGLLVFIYLIFRQIKKELLKSRVP